MSFREFTTAPARAWTPADGPQAPPPGQPQLFDPLKYCVFTTLTLIAWVVGPAVVASIVSAAGIVAYWQARRAGLVKSRCILGDTRLVIGYLALAFIVAFGSIVVRLFS